MPEFTQPHVAHLSPEQLAKVQQLEQKLPGIAVIAYEPVVVPARLTSEQVHALQQVEREVGACLVAYQTAR